MSSIRKSPDALLSVVDLQTAIQTSTGRDVCIQGIDFSIDAGNTLGLIGESGCGKSMTALSIMRLLPDEAVHDVNSRIYFADQDLLSLPEQKLQQIRGAQISMIFQEPQTCLNPVMSIGVQLAESVRLHQRINGKAVWVEVVRLLDRVQIPQAKRKINAFPHELSGGMKQRVMIAMALAGRPQLLIADEPTTALDASTQANILVLLKQLQSEDQMAMLFITHDLGLAKQICDHIAVMRAGQIVELKQTDRFFKSPQTQYSQTLLKASPILSRSQATQSKRRSTHANALVEVRDLKVHFPIRSKWLKRICGAHQAVCGVDFKLFAGKTLALVGESGSGKTTIGKTLVDLEKPQSGHLRFIDTQRPKMVFQDPFASLDPKMPIIHSLMEGMCAHQIGDTQLQREANMVRILKQVGLKPEHLWRYPHAFSGGQRQRICIARVLLLEPKVIVFDEPTSALDVVVQAEIIDLLNELQRQRGLSYLFITHNLALISQIADHVAVMYQGRIVEQGEVNTVLFSPQHPYTQRLLACSLNKVLE